MKQCPIDFFDPEVQHLAASAGCRLYRMQNDTGEGLISEYPILSGIDLFYNDFHMKDGQNQNKRPMPDTIEINHCREGRFECEFQNGDYQYIGAGDLSIHRLSHTTRQKRSAMASKWISRSPMMASREESVCCARGKSMVMEMP